MTVAIRVHLVKCRYLGSPLLRMPMNIHPWAAIVLMKMMIEGAICCKVPDLVVSRTPMPSHYRKNSHNPAINHRAPQVVRLTTLDHQLAWIDSLHQMASDLEVPLPVTLVRFNTILTPCLATSGGRSPLEPIRQGHPGVQDHDRNVNTASFHRSVATISHVLAEC